MAEHQNTLEEFNYRSNFRIYPVLGLGLRQKRSPISSAILIVKNRLENRERVNQHDYDRSH